MAKSDAAGPPDFKDQNAAEAWLQTQPREAGVAIAARTALRVLPLAHASLDEKLDRPTKTFVLPLFRATAQTLLLSYANKLSSKYSLPDLADHVASAINLADEEQKKQNFPSKEALSHCINTISSAFSFAYITQNNDLYLFFIAYARVESIKAAILYGMDTAERFAASRQKDFQSLAHYNSTSALAASPLWPSAEPQAVADQWRALKSHLLAADEGWEVWTDWYEARLRGDPFDPELERARVLIDEAIWKQGPKAVNAEIARLIAAHRAKAAEALAQDPRGGRFEARDGRLALAPGVGGVDPRADAMRPQAEAALRGLVERLRGTNQFGDLNSTASRFAELVALPSDAAAPNAFEMWSLSLSLAQWRVRDDAAQARTDGFAEALDVDTRRQLDLAVRVAAVFVRSFEEVQQFDTELAAFEGTVAASATQRAVLRAARAADALEPASYKVVEGVVEAGDGAGPIAARARVGGHFTVGNLVKGAAGLVVLGAGALATGYLGETGAGLARFHQTAERADRFLKDGRESIRDLLRDAPPDLRYAIEAATAPRPTPRPATPPQSP